MSVCQPPTPRELVDAPELAILAALDDILTLTLRALVAAHPQLADPECPHWARDGSAERDAAERSLAASAPLSTAIAEYGRATAGRRDPDDDPDTPF
jgi:hypothetical protein